MKGKQALTAFTIVMLVLTLAGGLWHNPLGWPAVGLYAVVLAAYTSGTVVKRLVELAKALRGLPTASLSSLDSTSSTLTITGVSE